MSDKIGNAGITPAKERTETVRKREKYDVPKMVRSYGEICVRTGSGDEFYEDEKGVFIQCFSTHRGVVHPNKFRTIG